MAGGGPARCWRQVQPAAWRWCAWRPHQRATERPGASLMTPSGAASWACGQAMGAAEVAVPQVQAHAGGCLCEIHQGMHIRCSCTRTWRLNLACWCPRRWCRRLHPQQEGGHGVLGAKQPQLPLVRLKAQLAPAALGQQGTAFACCEHLLLHAEAGEVEAPAVVATL
jgi:hypothetical protein